MLKSIQKIIVVVVCVFCSLYATVAFGAVPIWNSLLRKYHADETVRTVIFVQHTEGSSARVLLYQKDKDNSDAWTLLLQCEGFVGKNGISPDRQEGDGTTPCGDFGVIEAVGIKKNPGTKIPYRTTDNDLFCSSAYDENYNKIVSKKEINHVRDENHKRHHNLITAFSWTLTRSALSARGAEYFSIAWGQIHTQRVVLQSAKKI